MIIYLNNIQFNQRETINECCGSGDSRKRILFSTNTNNDIKESKYGGSGDPGPLL